MRRRAKIIPFPRRPAPTGEDRGLVEVYRCSQAEGVVVKGLFEADGIPVVLHSRLAHSVHPFTVGSQGEVALLVPARLADRGRRLLIRLAHGPDLT